MLKEQVSVGLDKLLEFINNVNLTLDDIAHTKKVS